MLHHVAWLAALLVGSVCARAETTISTIPEHLPIPAQRTILDVIDDQHGTAKLKVVLDLPPGPGPFPLVIYNHGSNEGSKSVELATVDQNMAVYYFLSRGYAVGSPLMRGFGGSSGVTLATGCRLEEVGRNAAADIEAVIAHLARQPMVDARRVVVAGSSMGGWNALAVGALGDPRVVAVVNFYGGLRSDTCRDGDDALKRGSRGYGAASHLPSLWFYGDNDRLWPKSLWQSMHRAYVEHGAPAELVAFGIFGTDAHKLLSSVVSMPVFATKLDSFLAGLRLPARIDHPEYVPLTPPATRYAALDDVDAVPFLNDAARTAYRDFLKKPLPRAFVIAPNITVRTEAGGFDPLARAITACRHAGAECWPYALNDEVVWAHPPPAPPETQFAKLDDVAALPYVNERGREGYRRFLATPRPRAFVIASDGSWSLSAGNADPMKAALAVCRDRQHPDCRAYAVDGAIVWPEAAATHQGRNSN